MHLILLVYAHLNYPHVKLILNIKLSIMSDKSAANVQCSKVYSDRSKARATHTGIRSYGIGRQFTKPEAAAYQATSLH